MSEYRGADGWIWDENGARRMTEPKTSTEAPVPKAEKKLTECPNCGSVSTWRAMEGYCTRCRWGMPEKADTTGRETKSCCGILGLVVALPLLGAGLGHATGGFGGLLVGLGLAVILGAGLAVWNAD